MGGIILGCGECKGGVGTGKWAGTRVVASGGVEAVGAQEAEET